MHLIFAFSKSALCITKTMNCSAHRSRKFLESSETIHHVHIVLCNVIFEYLFLDMNLPLFWVNLPTK